jgi:hypothetical protein
MIENIMLVLETLWYNADESPEVETRQWNQPESVRKAQGFNPGKEREEITVVPFLIYIPALPTNSQH